LFSRSHGCDISGGAKALEIGRAEKNIIEHLAGIEDFEVA